MIGVVRAARVVSRLAPAWHAAYRSDTTGLVQVAGRGAVHHDRRVACDRDVSLSVLSMTQRRRHVGTVLVIDVADLVFAITSRTPCRSAKFTNPGDDGGDVAVPVTIRVMLSVRLANAAAMLVASTLVA